MDKCFVSAHKILEKECILSLIVPAYNLSLQPKQKQK